MDRQQEIELLHRLLDDAKQLARSSDPVLTLAMPRISAIAHDALRLVDLDYVDNLVAAE
ncbi:MAG: hypothetical protein Q8K58_04470 [Acidimicrobiales bacterium]|nr:hypothetical protein [Acidimicrobiales bacterium]